MAADPTNLSTPKKIWIVLYALIAALAIAVVLPVCALIVGTVCAWIIEATHLFEIGEYGAWLGIILAMYTAYADMVVLPVVWWRISASRLGLTRRTNNAATAAISAAFCVTLVWVLWGEQAVTNPLHLDDVSDDGRYVLADRYLVPHRDIPGSSTLYRIDTRTGIAKQLSPSAHGYDSFASFSPDNGQVVFAHSEDEKQYTIMLADSSGNNSHPLLADGRNDSWPRFSRDGRTIYFIRTAGNAFDLFSSTLDGKNVTQVTHQNYTFKLGPYLQTVPSVSSDGKQMLLTTEESLQLCSLSGVSQQASNLTLQIPSAPPSSPIFVSGYFSADDNGLLFMASNEKGYDIYRLDLTSRKVQMLTNNDGYATDFRLSVNGGKAVFLKWKTSSFQKLPRSYQLELMEMKTGAVTPVNFSGLPE
jgi:hypothetical protein